MKTTAAEVILLPSDVAPVDPKLSANGRTAKSKPRSKKDIQMSKAKYSVGVGVDLGTMNIVSARQTPGGNVETKRIRDAFIDLDSEAKKLSASLRSTTSRRMTNSSFSGIPP